MNLEKESAMLTLIFADDTVQYRDKILPTGSIACMAMNIPKDSLDEALPYASGSRKSISCCIQAPQTSLLFHAIVPTKRRINPSENTLRKNQNHAIIFIQNSFQGEYHHEKALCGIHIKKKIPGVRC